MQRWRGLSEVPAGWGRSVVTIGVFDGVHRGHQRTIGHAVRRARELGVSAVVLTFDPHPAEVVRPGSHPAVLTEPARKAELIEGLGVDVLCVIPFTLEFSRLPSEAFVHDVLVTHLHAREVVVGENFRFGHRAAGDLDLLRRLGRTFGFTVEIAPLVASSEPVPVLSSTYVRACVDAGDVAAAASALGRPHRLEGIVVRGDGRGAKLGFPTANLATSPHAAIPADGIYAAWATRRAASTRGPRAGADRPRLGAAEAETGDLGTVPGDRLRLGEALRAAVSVGTNPTFAGRERRVEAYLLDFSGDIYGERLALDFVTRLREMRRYGAVDALVEQIRRDVDATRMALAP